MKKIIYILILFLFFTINVEADSFKFVWDEQTLNIDVKLNDNINKYIYIPKADLYKDGTKLENTNITYIYQGDWLYLLTDVDTSRVGKYQVWYKAQEHNYQPGQCSGYKTLVTFNVIDTEKPKFIEFKDEITYLIGGEKPKYNNLFTATDNSGNCTILFDESLIDYNTPGEYILTITASDGMLSLSKTSKIIVKDSIGPVVTFLGENNKIILTKGEEVALQKYFKAIDKIDGDVTSSIAYENFTTLEAKKFNLEVSFSDNNKNITTVNVLIEIVDKDEISIELYNKCLVLDYKDDINLALKNNIKSAYLGQKHIEDKVIINTNSLKNEVGSYIVTYSYNVNDKEEIVNCEVKLLSSAYPILLVENIYINVNQTINILDYITVSDESDKLIKDKIEYDDSLVDYSKEGVYPVRVTVTNTSNLSSTDTIYITIKGNEEKESYSITFILIIIMGVITAGLLFFILYSLRRKSNNQLN